MILPDPPQKQLRNKLVYSIVSHPCTWLGHTKCAKEEVDNISGFRRKGV